MAKYENEKSESSSSRPRKKTSGSTGSLLGSVVASTVATEGLFELVERLGLVDLVIDKVKQKVEEVDLDDLLDDVRGYLKRNPEVLVVSLGALTIASGIIVYLNARREWDGRERRSTSDDEPATVTPITRSKGSSRRKS